MGCSCSLKSSETILSVGVKSKLKVRLSFADQASRNKVHFILLQHVTTRLNIYCTGSSPDFRENIINMLLILTLPSLSLAEHSAAFSLSPLLRSPDLSNWLRAHSINQLRDSFVHILKDFSSVCYVCARE